MQICIQDYTIPPGDKRMSDLIVRFIDLCPAPTDFLLLAVRIFFIFTHYTLWAYKYPGSDLLYFPTLQFGASEIVFG